MKRRVLILFIIGALIGGAVYYNEMQAASAIVLTGIVTTDDVIVSSQVPGRLSELKVDQGDTVKRGDLLAVIEPAEMQADVSFYENSEKQAATQVSESEADLRFLTSQTQNQIAQAQANLATAQSQIIQVQADVEKARLALEHSEAARKQGVESIQAYDDARTTYDSEKARAQAVLQQADSSKAALDLAKSNLEQIEMRRATVEKNRHALAAAGAQKEKAQVQLGYTDIKAPIDGIVDVRAALTGEVVNPATAIVTLINPDDLWIRADVEETYIDKVKLGDKMEVKLPSGATREGVVFYRGIDADFATQRDVSRTKRDIKTFEVRLRCDNKDRALAVGMTAYVTLPLTK